MTNETSTLDYYNENTDSFIFGTLSADMSYARNRFSKHLPVSASILDYGCGAGRDTKVFLQQGFRVDAIDGSGKLCEKASEFTGIQVKQMLFQELDAEDRYDGIWACASILHLPKEELYDVFERMIRATKTNGVIYISFKYGTFEGLRGERYFTDFTKENLIAFLQPFSGLEIIEDWISEDVRKGREDEQWLNMILRKRE